MYKDQAGLRGLSDKQLYNIIKKNATAYVGSIVMKSLAPPHLKSQPLAAPGSRGGTSFNWLVSKHSLLCWPIETVQKFGKDVMAIFQDMCWRRGAIFNGVIAVPQFCCGNVKRFSQINGQPLAAGSDEVFFELPCGKCALMTPLLKLNESQPCWRCEECVENPSPSTVANERRVLQVWPLVNKDVGELHVPRPSPWQSNVTVLKAGSVEFVCGAPPQSWQWPNQPPQIDVPQIDVPQLGKIGKVTRFSFKDLDSDVLWNSSERYEPVG